MKLESFVFLLFVAILTGCGPKAVVKFDKNAWNKGRQSNPELNVSPWMLDDLVSNHLSPGIALADVTNLLGQPEIKFLLRSGVRVRGEFLKQTVYLYRPGMHNGWLVEGTNSLTLYFGDGGSYLKEWFPTFPVVRPINVKTSEATRDLLSNGGLYIGNLHYAGTQSQFDELLGEPDEKRTEYQLDYYLGKRSRFSFEEEFLELHFDRDQKLVRTMRLEH
jgi:hypothetical protein